MQMGFDLTGMREQFGSGYDQFVAEWMQLQQLLAGRGKAIAKAGRILRSMVEAYGAPTVKRICQLGKSPSWQRAQMLMEVYDWLGDVELTDEQAAVLDSVFGQRLRRDLRARVVQWVKEGKSAQDIDDLLEVIEPTGPRGPTVPPPPTEAEIRQRFAEQLQDEGWDVRLEQETNDHGAVDIVATRNGERRIVECKVDLDRKTAYYAIGQLAVYSRTYSTRDWWIVYWRRDDLAEPIISACKGLIGFQQVVMRATAGATA